MESRTMGLPTLPPAGLATTGVQFRLTSNWWWAFVFDLIVRQEFVRLSEYVDSGVLRCHLRVGVGSISVGMGSLCAAFKAAGGAGT